MARAVLVASRHPRRIRDGAIRRGGECRRDIKDGVVVPAVGGPEGHVRPLFHARIMSPASDVCGSEVKSGVRGEVWGSVVKSGGRR